MSSVELKEYKIKEVCDSIVDCVNKTAKHVDFETPFKMIRTTNVKSGWIKLEDVRCVTEETFKKWTRRVVPQIGDIILTREAPLGEVGLVRTNDKIFLGQRTILYRANKKIADNKFLYYQFLSDFVQGQFFSFGSGSTVEHIRIEDCETFKVLLPPHPTQQRIASILSAYDDLIEVNNQRIKLLEQTARELYKEWFVRMRFPGYKQAKFKKGVPEKWKTIAISDVVDFKMGQSPKSEFYNEDGIGLPFHQGVGNYGLRFPEHKVFCSVNGRIANEGDVLFSVRAPVGRLNIADRKLIIGRGLAALRHKKGLNNYLFYLLQNEFSKEDLIGNGSIFNSVGKDELKKFKIFNVGDLANQFNDFVEPIDKQLLVLIHQNTQLRQIRDRLLPRLISGKLQVSESRMERIKG